LSVNDALIIGTYSTTKVDTYDWSEDLPSMSDYEKIVVDTTKIFNFWSPDGTLQDSDGEIHSLSERTVLVDRIESRLQSVKEKLIEILEYHVNVYVLYIPHIKMNISVATSPLSTVEAPWPATSTFRHNFSKIWCPISMKVIEEIGRTIVPLDITYNAYFQDIQVWEYRFDKYSLDITEFQEHYYPKGFAVTPILKDIAVNNASQPIAVKFVPRFHKMGVDEESLWYPEHERPYEREPHHIGGNLILLPLRNKKDSSDSIEIILGHKAEFERIVTYAQLETSETELPKPQNVEKQPRYPRLTWLCRFFLDLYKATIEAITRAYKG